MKHDEVAAHLTCHNKQRKVDKASDEIVQVHVYQILIIMKIEFEIEEKEAVLLLKILQQFMGQTNNPNVLKSLSKIASEIESDFQIGNQIFLLLRTRLYDYTNHNVMLPESDMRIFLGMSSNFITRVGGLEREANIVFIQIVKNNKPNVDIRKLKQIPLDEIKKCKLISDVQEIIQSAYENIS